MKVKINKFPKVGDKRRIDVQVDKFDTWNLDHTLALIIYPALIQLKATKHGIPSEFVDDIGGEDYSDQASFDFYKETHTESFNKAVLRWDEVLDKMIWSFGELIKDDYSDKYRHGKSGWDFVESDHMYPNPISGVMEKTFQVVDKDPTSHWHDYIGQMEHEARMQEGFELFGKYYRSLWD